MMYSIGVRAREYRGLKPYMYLVGLLTNEDKAIGHQNTGHPKLCRETGAAVLVTRHVQPETGAATLRDHLLGLLHPAEALNQ